MVKKNGFRTVKRLATLLLATATLLFIITLFLPQTLTVRALKSIAEAAMVGGLADWFAVTALFQEIPFARSKTAIIPRNKQRIAENLGQFIEEKFLSTDSMVALIQRHDPSQKLANWLSAPESAERLSQLLRQLISGFLKAGSDEHIRRFLHQGIHRAIDKVDFSRTAVLLLESLTRENRHQELLDALIRQLTKALGHPHSRELIASQISQWFMKEYPTISRIVSVEWLGVKGADKVTSMVDTLLLEIAQDEHHQLRNSVNRMVSRFITSLNSDPQMQARTERLKQWLKEDETFNRYTGELWDDLRHWLNDDMQRADSLTGRQIARATLWLGETLSQDPQLRASFNHHFEQAVIHAGPEFSRFLTRHISDTVKSWDDKQLSAQIEQNIGDDLQRIRINGTVIGGTLGLLLFLFSLLPSVIHFPTAWFG